MKKFLQIVLGVIVGVLILNILGVIIFFGIVGAMSSGSEQTTKPNTVLVFDLDKSIVERSSDDALAEAMSKLRNESSSFGLDNILDNIEKAVYDDNVSGILLEGGDITAAPATLEEIRNALNKFKESGKFVYSYANSYSQRGYYVASVADSVMMVPTGMADIRGLSLSTMFYTNLMKKLGVEAQIIRHGQFKSAVEPYFLNKMSDASRLQMQTLANSIWSRMVTDISSARGIEDSVINDVADKFSSIYPKSLIDSKLVDCLIYRDQYLSFIKTKLGVAEKDDINSIEMSDYTDIVVPKDDAKYVKNKIAVVYAVGEIFDGTGSADEGIYGDDLAKTIRKVRRDSSIKAVVLRVNSPGGSALASDIIWREVKLTQGVKPVVVSMGDYAASGGYYISCAADSIVAEATTLTGSIGVFGMIPCFEKTAEMVGVSVDGVKTNSSSDALTPYRKMTSYETNVMQNMVEQTYSEFITRCADGRKMTTEQIDSIGQGRVWAGSDAIRIGLVDKIGHIGDAIDIAARMASLDEYRIEKLPEEEDQLTKLMNMISGDAKAKIGCAIMGDDFKIIEQVSKLKKRSGVQARVEYDINIE